MANEEKSFLEALKKLRKAESGRKEKRKFDQTIDLIVNLKNFDVRRESFNVFIRLPHRIKEKRVAGFFEKDSEFVDVIKKEEFVKYKEKKDAKKLTKEYDNFIANAKLMPAIATAFGRVFGPVGKMPSPQLGILPNEDDKVVQSVLENVNSTVRIMVKEPSIKVGVAKDSFKNEEVVENMVTVYKKLLESLPKGADNVRNIKIKFTMSKPVGVGM